MSSKCVNILFAPSSSPIRSNPMTPTNLHIRRPLWFARTYYCEASRRRPKVYNLTFVDFSCALNTILLAQMFDRLSSLGTMSWIVRWLLSHFIKRLQRVCLNGRCTSYLYSIMDELQWAAPSLFLFSLQTDSLTSCYVWVLKYADDFYSKYFDQEELDASAHIDAIFTLQPRTIF